MQEEILKKVVLEHFETEARFTGWRVVWLLEENQTTWRIWSFNFEDIFTRYVHKNSFGERIKPL